MNSGAARFERPSSPLEMRALLGKARKTLWWALALALGVHVSLTRIAGSEAEQKVAKPLTTQFVKRQPRLTKPLELKKRPQPKLRRVQREMVAVKARLERGATQARFQATPLLGGLARPRADIGRVARFAGVEMEPTSVAQAVEGAKDVEERIDMSLELLDIEALDTGQYHAMVVQGSGDKTNIKGFCHLAIAQIEGAYPQSGDTFDFRCIAGFSRLAAYMNQWTDIKVDILGRLTLDNAELFKVPWLLLSAFLSFQLTNSQLENLGNYLTLGGFAFADGYGARDKAEGWSPGLKGLHGALVQALKTQGIEPVLEKLPNSHPIYHCYFDFDGPPPGADAGDKHQYPELTVMREYLEGIGLDGRLVALLSRKLYTGAWTFFGPDNYVGSAWTFMDPQGSFRFGVNTIIFALTQEGSITHRLMESVR